MCSLRLWSAALCQRCLCTSRPVSAARFEEGGQADVPNHFSPRPPPTPAAPHARLQLVASLGNRSDSSALAELLGNGRVGAEVYSSEFQDRCVCARGGSPLGWMAAPRRAAASVSRAPGGPMCVPLPRVVPLAPVLFLSGVVTSSCSHCTPCSECFSTSLCRWFPRPGPAVLAISKVTPTLSSPCVFGDGFCHLRMLSPSPRTRCVRPSLCRLHPSFRLLPPPVVPARENAVKVGGVGAHLCPVLASLSFRAPDPVARTLS